MLPKNQKTISKQKRVNKRKKKDQGKIITLFAWNKNLKWWIIHLFYNVVENKSIFLILLKKLEILKVFLNTCICYVVNNYTLNEFYCVLDYGHGVYYISKCFNIDSK